MSRPLSRVCQRSRKEVQSASRMASFCLGGEISLLALLSFQALAHGLSSCPCADPLLCNPITDVKDFEVYVFDVGGKKWKSYDWTQVTTVAAFGKYDPELLCYAHSKRARVVLKGDVQLTDVVDPNKRTAWIAQQLDLAKKQYMDGINIDIEQAVNASSPEYYALTALVQETAEAFHREILGSQVTFDVAWSPKCIDERYYNYSGIAEVSDFVFVMSYDEQSQIWTECIAAANAPYNQTLAAYDDYLRLEIDPKKLVMGVPWYGYDYVCLDLSEITMQNLAAMFSDWCCKEPCMAWSPLVEKVGSRLLQSQEDKCTLERVPFRGAPCSDAAGRQVPYRTIMKQVNSSITGRLWDEQQKAPYYNYKDATGKTHQVWYDDPESISLKAAYVKKRGLRGIGMWNGNILDYSDDPKAKEQTEAMWKALRP